MLETGELSASPGDIWPNHVRIGIGIAAGSLGWRAFGNFASRGLSTH